MKKVVCYFLTTNLSAFIFSLTWQPCFRARSPIGMGPSQVFAGRVGSGLSWCECGLMRV